MFLAKGKISLRWASRRWKSSGIPVSNLHRLKTLYVAMPSAVTQCCPSNTSMRPSACQAAS